MNEFLQPGQTRDQSSQVGKVVVTSVSSSHPGGGVKGSWPPAALTTPTTILITTSGRLLISSIHTIQLESFRVCSDTLNLFARHVGLTLAESFSPEAILKAFTNLNPSQITLVTVTLVPGPESWISNRPNHVPRLCSSIFKIPVCLL
ncbi:hypothetical protein VTL71DRAFT_14215 [Oculimacula yallundae]|uniref:Uncharacterized protein n=1 Tax=Oculimacula yallundae TaxID=86028 RepID=A0ABR4CHU5_9HELO